MAKKENYTSEMRAKYLEDLKNYLSECDGVLYFVGKSKDRDGFINGYSVFVNVIRNHKPKLVSISHILSIALYDRTPKEVCGGFVIQGRNYGCGSKYGLLEDICRATDYIPDGITTNQDPKINYKGTLTANVV
jgi:hypothetical protein